MDIILIAIGLMMLFSWGYASFTVYNKVENLTKNERANLIFAVFTWGLFLLGYMAE